MKKLKIFLIIILFNIILNIPIKNVLAEDLSAFEMGLLDTARGTGHASMPISTYTPAEIIGIIISAVLALLGVIFLILIIYSGYIWMTARGNEQSVEKAKNMLRDSVIGLIIVLGAFAITKFIFMNYYTGGVV